MQADTGESSISINRRSDDAALPNIMEGLRQGYRLKIDHIIGKAYLTGLPDKHPLMMRSKIITISRARKLEREGVITQSGIDQYMLVNQE